MKSQDSYFLLSLYINLSQIRKKVTDKQTKHNILKYFCLPVSVSAVALLDLCLFCDIHRKLAEVDRRVGSCWVSLPSG